MSNDEKRKPGRPAVPKFDAEAELANLTLCLSKMAHFSGQERILDEFKIDRWKPGKKDMGKYKD